MSARRKFWSWFARPAAPLAASGSDGRRVLVAGASGAIGSALAEAFAADGARLALHGRRADALAGLAARLTTADGTAPAVLCADCASTDGAQALFTAAEAALGGAPEVLVIAIGSARDDALPMLGDADAAAVIADNLAPVVHLCEAMRAARARAGGGGRIVIVSSITGLVGQPMRTLYGAAKGAVIAYAKSLARETAASGLTVNCLAPQVLDGGLASLMRAHVRQTLLGATPAARACTPQDLVDAARFLAAPGAGYVTGTVVNVTGGLVTW